MPNLALSVDPFRTLIAGNPLFTVNVSTFASINIDLPAKVAELAIFISTAAWFTKPKELALAVLPS